MREVKVLRIFGVAELCRELNLTRHRIYSLMSKGAPLPTYEAFTNSKRSQSFWTEAAVEQWRTFVADLERHPYSTRSHPVPPADGAFSDHKAVNIIGDGHVVTWRLWFQPTTTTWWFSTPYGWYVSDDGASWRDTGRMMKPPGGYRPVPRQGHDSRSAHWMKRVQRAANEVQERLSATDESEDDDGE